MKLQDQVCTLEQAKRLKELGIEYDAYFYHDVHDGMGGEQKKGESSIRDHLQRSSMSYPAFTAAELGVMLPEYLSIDSYRMHVHSYKQEQNNSPALWTITMGKSSDKEVPDFDSHKEAQARAAMLIYLLENKLTTAEECNKRLTQ